MHPHRETDFTTRSRGHASLRTGRGAGRVRPLPPTALDALHRSAPELGGAVLAPRRALPLAHPHGVGGPPILRGIAEMIGAGRLAPPPRTAAQARRVSLGTSLSPFNQTSRRP